MSSIFNDFPYTDSEFDQSDEVQRKDEAEVENNTHYISPAMINEYKPTNSEVVSIHPACRNPTVTQF